MPPSILVCPSGQLKLAIDRSIAFIDENYNSRIGGKKAITLMTCEGKERSTFDQP